MSYPFVEARNYTSGRIKPIRLIVIHDMEWAEKPDTAEACANYFHTTTREASAHYCVDNNSVVQCVRDEDTAWAAPYANADGLQIENAGFASQSRGDWSDAYSMAELRVSAQLVAELCHKHGISPVHLSNADLQAGKKGLVGHVQVTEVYGPAGGHTDPGPNFPWDVYMGLVQAAYNPAPPTAPIPSLGGDMLFRDETGTIYFHMVKNGQSVLSPIPSSEWVKRGGNPVVWQSTRAELLAHGFIFG